MNNSSDPPMHICCGREPDNMLLLNTKYFKYVRLFISTEMEPFSLFMNNPRWMRNLRFPNSRGMGPDN